MYYFILCMDLISMKLLGLADALSLIVSDADKQWGIIIGWCDTCMGTAEVATYPGPLSMRLCFAWRSIPGLCIVFTSQKLDIFA